MITLLVGSLFILNLSEAGRMVTSRDCVRT